jgi:hypothetical protein
VVRSQIGSLTPNLSFGHNLCFKYSNGSCKPILDIYISRNFQWYKENFQSNEFWPLIFFSKDSRVHWNYNSQSGSPLGSVCTHSLTPSYILVSMKCDSWVSLSACTFASPTLRLWQRMTQIRNIIVLLIITF